MVARLTTNQEVVVSSTTSVIFFVLFSRSFLTFLIAIRDFAIRLRDQCLVSPRT